MRNNISPNYATEQISAALKAAREAKGLTQRALSALAGVPQAHISKIESNAVDLRLTSLLSLAHALDLEVTLVPRKALPAVQSLARTAGTSLAAPLISKDLALASQAVSRLQKAMDGPELARLSEHLAELTRMQAAVTDSAVARNLRKTIEAIDASDGFKKLHAASKLADHMRKTLRHIRLAGGEAPRPAYQLEDDADG